MQSVDRLINSKLPYQQPINFLCRSSHAFDPEQRLLLFVYLCMLTWNVCADPNVSHFKWSTEGVAKYFDHDLIGPRFDGMYVVDRPSITVPPVCVCLRARVIILSLLRHV